MAVPAGYSDEEWDSDFDEITFEDRALRLKTINQINQEINETEDQKLLTEIRYGNIEIVKELIENGADVNYKPSWREWSPLMIAASLANESVIVLLLKYGANVNVKEGTTSPLMCLCNTSETNNEDEILRCFNILLDAGANINVYSETRETALMNAANQGYSKIVHRLLELGADADARSLNGWSPIFYAAHKGDLESVKTLKDAGCNLNLYDRSGQTLYEIASNNNFKEIAKLVITLKNSDATEYLDSFLIDETLSNYETVWSEIPNYRKSINDGFYMDVIKTIGATGMKSIISVFIKNKIGYGQFLINSEECWEKLGVNLSFDRRKLITFAHDIMEKNWTKKALVDFENDDPDLFTIVQKLLNDIRIMHILIATVHVCKCELERFDNNIDGDSLKQMLIKMHETVTFSKRTIHLADDLLKQIELKSNIYSADYINSKSCFQLGKICFINKIRCYTFIFVSLICICYPFKNSINRLLKSSFLNIFH